MAYFREITEHYRIEKTLRARAGGGVFRASDPVTAAPVTLKLFPLADVPPESAQDFVRAMGILQALRHPSLPTLFDFGFTPDGHAFLVFEYVDGRGAEALQGGSPAQILPLLGQVLDGLERLHEEDLAHLNLAPENLLVVPGPAPGRIQMVGLGSAPLRAPGDRPEREAAAYAAPEVGRPEVLELAPWRADLFSLALIACRLLEARLDANPDDLHALQVTLPLGVTFELEDDQILKEVLERALRRRPEARPGFAEMRQAFTRALVGTSGPRRLPESRIFLSPEPESEPWLPLPGPKAAPPLRDPLEDTNPVFHPAPAPIPAPIPALSAPPPTTTPAIPAPAAFRDPAPVDPEPALLEAPPLPEPLPESLSEPVPVPGPVAAPPPPAARRRRGLLLWGGVAAAVLAAAAVGFLSLRSRPETPAPGVVARRRAPAPPTLPPTPVPTVAAPAPPPPLPAQLAAASDAFADGKDDVARQSLAALTREDEAAFTPEACHVYGVLRSSLDAIDVAARSRRATDFRAALKAGDLPQLAAAFRSITPQERTALQAQPGLRKDLAAAKQAVDLYQRYTKAVKAGEPVELLTAAGAVSAAFPLFKEAADRREKVAAGLEAEAETLAQTGAVDSAAERLETLRRGWPERAGVGDRIARYSAEQRSDQGMAATLASVTAAESRQRPDEGLALLAGAKPTPPYEGRFREAQNRLESQLAQLDSHPPVVQITAAPEALEFDKGAAVHIPLRITDDFQVKTVTIHVRPEGGAWTELACNRSGADCLVEVPESLHQNKTIELYAVATDLSGHKGQLGSAEKPQLIRRKHWYDRLRGKG
jgi:serine/threonine protein kinase